MAYKKEEMIKQCIKAIDNNSLMFIEHIICYVPFSKPTFYKHKLNEVDVIKEAINNNKVSMKVDLLAKWHTSDNATLQIALYKLIGNKEDYMRLANARQENNVTIEEKVVEGFIYIQPNEELTQLNE